MGTQMFTKALLLLAFFPLVASESIQLKPGKFDLFTFLCDCKTVFFLSVQPSMTVARQAYDSCHLYKQVTAQESSNLLCLQNHVCMMDTAGKERNVVCISEMPSVPQLFCVSRNVQLFTYIYSIIEPLLLNFLYLLAKLECPPTDGLIGICVEECNNDSDCLDYEKCCSNGCGHQCTIAIPGEI